MSTSRRDPPNDEPLPRSLLVLIALIFLVLGGLAALIANDVRDDTTDTTVPSAIVTVPSGQGVTSTSTVSGTRPTTSTD